MFKNFAAAYGTFCLLFFVVYAAAGRIHGGQLLGVLAAVFLSFVYACFATGRERALIEQLRERVRELEEPGAGVADVGSAAEERPGYR
jgi:hypothetical protein